MPIPTSPVAGLFAVVALVGVIVGSFLNVVIFRGPSVWRLVDGDHRGGLAAPRSYCPSCKAPIPAWRLIPVASYIIQGGRCATCRAPIPLRYPIVEIMGALVATASLAVFGPSWPALAVSVFGWALIALAFIDLETGYLPDAITLPLIVAGLGMNALGAGIPIGHAVIGAASGFVAFWLIGGVFKALRGKDGLGHGDKKLMAAIGAWGGWMVLPAVVLIGALTTLGVIGAGMLQGKNISANAPVPFGPGLCAAGFSCLLAWRWLFNGP